MFHINHSGKNIAKIAEDMRRTAENTKVWALATVWKIFLW